MVLILVNTRKNLSSEEIPELFCVLQRDFYLYYSSLCQPLHTQRKLADFAKSALQYQRFEPRPFKFLIDLQQCAIGLTCKNIGFEDCKIDQAKERGLRVLSTPASFPSEE